MEQLNSETNSDVLWSKNSCFVLYNMNFNQNKDCYHPDSTVQGYDFNITFPQKQLCQLNSTK